MLTQVLKTKICIVGAGPAGATTSLFLTKNKIEHIIVDAAIFPRDKVCGDAIDLKVIRVLNQLNKKFVHELLTDDNFIKSWGANVIISRNKQYHFDLQKKEYSLPFFMVCRRAYFDNFLVGKIDKAYATFFQDTKVKTLNKSGNKWTITASNSNNEVTITADMIVGADGDHSTVLRNLGERKIDRRHYAGALRQYWKGISDLNTTNRMEVYLPKSLPLAYLWIFPVGNGEANVGCGLVSDIISEKSVDLKKLFQQLIREDPAISYRFLNAEPLEKPIGWGLPFASQPRKVFGNGYLLVGDAAALISPTTGEGIGPGMMSGFIASEFLTRAINHNDFSEHMFRHYDREIYKRLKGDVRKYKFLRSISPRLYNALINIWSGMGISSFIFKMSAAKWIKTATTKIEVEM